MAIFGYARVSTRNQDVAAQVAELMTAGCAKVYREKASGAKTDRPELGKIIGRLEPGDVLMVTRLDRLARSTRDLLNVIEEVSKRSAGFRSLKDIWADTTSPRPSDVDRVGRLGRVRASADSRQDRRGEKAGS